jgi:hypothetical protein
MNDTEDRPRAADLRQVRVDRPAPRRWYHRLFRIAPRARVESRAIPTASQLDLHVHIDHRAPK